MQIRRLINLLEDIESSYNRLSKAGIGTPADALSVSTTATTPPVDPNAKDAHSALAQGTAPTAKAGPGGYAGSGQIRGNSIISNPEAWDQNSSPEGQKALEKLFSKYKDSIAIHTPLELRRQAGIHDEKASVLDAPWRYEGDGTQVQTPRGNLLSGMHHKGFHDANAPSDVLPIPPIKVLNVGSGEVDGVAGFLVSSGHDDASIARSMKYYFPDLKDQNIAQSIHSARDFTRAGYNVGTSYAVASPHDHTANPMGPFKHSGAMPTIDPDVAGVGAGLMYDMGVDRKAAASSIKSAYKTKSGANTWHGYTEIDPEHKEGMAYSMPNSYQVGGFEVSEQPETDDYGKPTGRKIVYANKMGKYLGGPKGKGKGSMDSFWNGTPAQWDKDKEEFLGHLKAAR